MTPKQIAGIVARSALAQLKVAAERGVALDVNSCEDIAIAIGNGAAQNLAAMQWDESDVMVDASGVDWAEAAEKLNASKRVRRPIVLAAATPEQLDRWAAMAAVPGVKPKAGTLRRDMEQWADAMQLNAGSPPLDSKRITEFANKLDGYVRSAAAAGWRELTSPHPWRRKPPGVTWPNGPVEETCADCGTDPRNSIHKVIP